MNCARIIYARLNRQRGQYKSRARIGSEVETYVQDKVEVEKVEEVGAETGESTSGSTGASDL
jgi:hypothetical protein